MNFLLFSKVWKLIKYCIKIRGVLLQLKELFVQNTVFILLVLSWQFAYNCWKVILLYMIVSHPKTLSIRTQAKQSSFSWGIYRLGSRRWKLILICFDEVHFLTLLTIKIVKPSSSPWGLIVPRENFSLVRFMIQWHHQSIFKKMWKDNT